ncbi:hypothetical protein O6H91_01G161500 [Diphasiastrum complanatum]|uniref:Uncharacterized protein n=1 Tax=Diphasiastrum complanatum TaxID=34168 RepID=A0ACC2EY60_DIPCM|nr:hypothetical protein O6H91_01G161500 [Diphasiastrum complanatum]
MMMMRQSRVLSTIAKRVVQRSSSAPSTCAPVKAFPHSAHICSNRSTGSILKHSELWMAYGNTQLQWKNHVVQVTCFSSAASPEASSKEGEPGVSGEEGSANGDDVEPVTRAKEGAGKSEKSENGSVKSNEDLVKENEHLKDALEDRDTLLEEKDKSLSELKDRLLRSYAEVENVMERARREAENSRKFAIQNFAKSLLPVADNLGRAAAAVPEGFHSSESSDSSEAGKLLLSLLEGVKMTEKELLQVFKKYGVEKFKPTGQAFDPNFHLAICEVQDPEKEPGSVALVFKPGYMLHDRVIRPAEVAVVKDDTK